MGGWEVGRWTGIRRDILVEWSHWQMAYLQNCLKRRGDWIRAVGRPWLLLHLARALVRHPNQRATAHIPLRKAGRGVGDDSNSDCGPCSISLCVFHNAQSAAKQWVDALVRRSLNLEAAQTRSSGRSAAPKVTIDA